MIFMDAMTRFTAIPKIAVLVIIFCLVCGSICIPLSIIGRYYIGVLLWEFHCWEPMIAGLRLAVKILWLGVLHGFSEFSVMATLSIFYYNLTLLDWQLLKQSAPRKGNHMPPFLLFLHNFSFFSKKFFNDRFNFFSA
jgi:hypothetical protein